MLWVESNWQDTNLRHRVDQLTVSRIAMDGEKQPAVFEVAITWCL